MTSPSRNQRGGHVPLPGGASLSFGDAVEMVCSATGDASLDGALDKLAVEYRPATSDEARELIRALVLIPGYEEEREQAVRRLTRSLADSQLDSAEVLFGLDGVAPPSRYRDTLDRLAKRCPTGGLDSLSASVLIAAQGDDPFAIEVLCAIAGISFKDLTGRLDGSVGRSNVGDMEPSEIRAAFDLIDGVVCGSRETRVPGAMLARPIELMPLLEGKAGGWSAVEELRLKGVPYEALLAQRAVGGAWLAHRNRTSGTLPAVVAERLTTLLESKDVRLMRSTSVGGDTAPRALVNHSGCDKQVGIVAFDARARPSFGVVFSSARDHGTARANAGRLLQMERNPGLPTALVLVGPGWSKRHETAALATAFDGRVYSEKDLEQLAEAIALRVRPTKGRAD